MGKYDKVVVNLKDLPVQDTTYQDKVEKVKQELTADTSYTPESLARMYREAREGLDPNAGLESIIEHLDGRQSTAEERTALIQLLGKDGLEALLYECNLKIEAVTQLLIKSEDDSEPGWGMYGAKANAVRLSDGTSISVQEEPSCKVENKDEFRKWCIREGLENSLQLWPSTMEAITRDRLVRGLPEPDGVTAYRRRKIVLRNPRKGSGDD